MSSNPLKKLAGETAIYGLSTILARIVNFFFVPFYTRILSTESYGEVTEFMSYIAVLQVILVLGLETGCFRYANKHKNPGAVFGNALLTVAIISVTSFLAFAFASGYLSDLLGYHGYSYVFTCVGAILAIDTFTAILFARLRFEHKALKFATFKTIKILSETFFNIFLFLILPKIVAGGSSETILGFIPVKPDFSYVIIAILLSCIVSIILFIPEIFKIKFRFDRTLWRDMIKYSIPLMIAGLPGILNDFSDRIMFRFFSPDGAVWKSDLGIFQAGTKLAALMMLFIQMFRFAAEPFFFSQNENRESRSLYAKVLEHFTAFCMLIFLGILLYIDVIELILGANFRSGVSILPIMLLAYLLLGISFNVSMWYKLSGHTNIAVYITITGLVVTLAVNILFMPIYSYHAAAWGHLLSYLVMLVLSVSLGNKYYPIPYKWGKIAIIIGSALAIYALSLLLPQMHTIYKHALHTLFILLYIFVYLKTEKISVWRLKL